MEFLTLHQLSRELDKPEKVLRYRFNLLKMEGKLLDGEDYIRDEYIDDQHFVYKINPLTFMHKTGLNVVPKPVVPEQDVGYQTGTNLGTKDMDFGTKVDTKPEEMVTKPEHKLEPNSYDKEMTNDFIAVLKEQLKMKDKQIADAMTQVKDLQEINNMAMGEVVQLNRTIRQLAAPTRDTNSQTDGYQNGNVIDADVSTNLGTKDAEFGTKGTDFGTTTDQEQIKKESYPTE